MNDGGLVTVPFVDLKTQHRILREELFAAFGSAIERCDFILGRTLESFERNFAAFVETKAAVGVSNGLDALRLSLAALEIGPGDSVIIPANTYIATALAVNAVGAKPVLVDCDPSTYSIDPVLVESSLRPEVRAIIPVHLTGQSADMDPLLDIAERCNLHVIEDAAQAHGTRYKGRCCGSLGAAGCFSFYPAKNLGACGDGGIVTTNNVELADKLFELRNYGQRQKNHHLSKGVNARLDTLQAAILEVKLRHLTRWNSARYEHAQRYRELLQGVGDLSFQQEAPYSNHVYHLFIVETDWRDPLRDYFASIGIETAVHYPTPIHLQPAYRELGYRRGDFPNAERLADRMLSLPMFPELSEPQIEAVASGFRRFFDKQLNSNKRKREPDRPASLSQSRE
jgi:dTDP-4-amino-4,6-dideoxygalactose transaminase